jgi:hypothetical protein
MSGQLDAVPLTRQDPILNDLAEFIDHGDEEPGMAD